MINHKTHKDLDPGDIIYLEVPFVENTSEYYHGYDPSLIIDQPVTDRQGRTAKRRPVLVVANEKNNFYYMPITSRHRQRDSYYHYHLPNNKELPGSDRYESYVETANVYRYQPKSYEKFKHYTTIKPYDFDKISQLANQHLNTITKEGDSYRYGSTKAVRQYMNSLTNQGFKKRNNTYTKDKLTVTVTRHIVTRHFDYTLEQVRMIHQNPLKIDLSDLENTQNIQH